MQACREKGSMVTAARCGAHILPVVIAAAMLSGCGNEIEGHVSPSRCPQHTLAQWKEQLVGPGQHIKVIDKEPTRVTWRIVDRRDDRGQLVEFIRERGSENWARLCI